MDAGVGPGTRLVLGLSGGVDSLSLLHLLHRLCPALGFALSAIHVHHGLSPQADRWQALCEAHCARLGIPLLTERVAVARDAHGLEAAARQVRYAVLEAQPADWLVLGHHLDDQAETLVFRLLRGTGLRGAGAMRGVERPAQGLPRLRPLLGTRRREIEAWARHQGWAWVEDESNADTAYSRNYLRHDVFPDWEARFPGAAAALARAAGHFQEASDLLDELAAQDAAACGGLSWRLAEFLALSEPRQRNLLRWAVRGRGGLAPETSRLAEAIRQLGQGGATAALRLPLGVWALGAYRGRVWLEPADWGGRAVAEIRLDWAAVPGQTLPWGSGQVVFSPAQGQGLDWARLAGSPVVLTGPWPGLRLRLGPGRPTRSFKNLCQEAGLPSWWRDHLPVLRVGEAAAWIGGLGVAAEFACGAEAMGLVPNWSPPV